MHSAGTEQVTTASTTSRPISALLISIRKPKRLTGLLLCHGQAKPKADEGKIAVITTAPSSDQLLNAANQPWQAYSMIHAAGLSAKMVGNAGLSLQHCHAG